MAYGSGTPWFMRSPAGPIPQPLNPSFTNTQVTSLPWGAGNMGPSSYARPTAPIPQVSPIPPGAGAGYYDIAGLYTQPPVNTGARMLNPSMTNTQVASIPDGVAAQALGARRFPNPSFTNTQVSSLPMGARPSFAPRPSPAAPFMRGPAGSIPQGAGAGYYDIASLYTPTEVNTGARMVSPAMTNTQVSSLPMGAGDMSPASFRNPSYVAGEFRSTSQLNPGFTNTRVSSIPSPNMASTVRPSSVPYGAGAGADAAGLSNLYSGGPTTHVRAMQSPTLGGSSPLPPPPPTTAAGLPTRTSKLTPPPTAAAADQAANSWARLNATLGGSMFNQEGAGLLTQNIGGKVGGVGRIGSSLLPMAANNWFQSQGYDRNSNPAVYDFVDGTLGGASVGGMTGNPVVAAATGLAAGNASLGFLNAQNQMDNSAQVMQKFTGVSEDQANALARGQSIVGGIVGNDPGAIWAGVTGDSADSLMDIPRSIPALGGMFGAKSGDKEQQGGSWLERAEAAVPVAERYSAEKLGTIINEFGLDPQTQQDILTQYNDAIRVAEISPTVFTEAELTTPDDSGQAMMTADQFETAKKNGTVTKQEDGSYALVQTPDMVRQAMYDQIVQSLPEYRQQVAAEQKSIQDQAALQAAMVNLIPMATQPFYDQANTGYASLGAALRGLPAEAQGAGQAMMDAYAGGAGRYGDALALQLANQPTYDRMMADIEAAQAQQNQYDAAIQNAQMYASLREQYPDLFPTSDSAGTDDLLSQLLAGG